MTEYLARGFPGSPPESVVGPSRTAVLAHMRAEFFSGLRAKQAASLLAVKLLNAKKFRDLGGEDGERSGLAIVVAWLREALGGVSVVGLEDEEKLVLFLPGTELVRAEKAAKQAIDRGKNEGVELGGRIVPVRIGIGLADGSRTGVRWVDTLIGVAVEGASVSCAGGGNHCVHTELYDGVQSRLERELSEDAKHEPEAEHATEPVSEPEPVIEAPAPQPAPEPEPPPDVSIEHSPESQVTALVARDEVAEVRRELVELAMQRARVEWHERATKLSEEHTTQIDRLERRIAKLNAALADAEEQIDGLQSMRARDPGVASWYRDVQGLSDGEENHELKRELMGMIFQANMELAQELRGT